MRFCSFVSAAALLSAGITARADTFNFTFGSSSSVFTGSGVLTTGAAEAPGEYLITSVTGTAETTASGPDLVIRSILAPGVFPTPTNGGTFPANDNTVFVTNGLGNFSQDGLSFILGNGAQINLYDDGLGDDALLERTNGTDVYEDATITITAVASTPEPGSVVLLGTGMLGVAGTLKRRFL